VKALRKKEIYISEPEGNSIKERKISKNKKGGGRRLDSHRSIL